MARKKTDDAEETTTEVTEETAAAPEATETAAAPVEPTAEAAAEAQPEAEAPAQEVTAKATPEEAAPAPALEAAAEAPTSEVAAEAPTAEAEPAKPARARKAAKSADEPEEAAPAPPAAAKAAAKPKAAGPVTADGRRRRKTRIGIVHSNKMTQTVVVSIENKVRHPLYGKTIRRTTKFKAHDQNSECGPGDRVEIMETRPISREKRWRVVRIVEKAK